MSFSLNLPNLQKRLSKFTRSLSASSPVWRSVPSVLISSGSSPSSDSILTYLFGFSLPSMTLHLSPTFAHLYVPADLISCFKPLESTLTFTSFLTKNISEFSVSADSVGNILPNSNSEKNVLEAFQHIMAVKDEVEQNVINTGCLFLSELLKRKVVPLVSKLNSELSNEDNQSNNDPESITDLDTNSNNESKYRLRREKSFDKELLEVSNSYLKEFEQEQEKEENELEKIIFSPSSSIITTSITNITNNNKVNSKTVRVFRVKLKAISGNYPVELERTLLLDNEDSLLEQEYNQMLELFRRVVLKARSTFPLSSIKDVAASFISSLSSEVSKRVFFKGEFLKSVEIKGLAPSPFTLSHSNTDKESKEGESKEGSVIRKEDLKLKDNMVFSLSISSSISLNNDHSNNTEEDENKEGSLEIGLSDVISIGSKASLFTHCGRKFSKISATSSSATKEEEEIEVDDNNNTSSNRDRTKKRSERLKKVLDNDSFVSALNSIKPLLLQNSSLFSERLKTEKEELLKNTSSESVSSLSASSAKTLKERVLRLCSLQKNSLEEEDLNTEINRGSLNIDEARDLVYLPIFGRTVPVSLQLVHAVTFSEISEVSFLRISFVPLNSFIIDSDTQNKSGRSVRESKEGKGELIDITDEKENDIDLTDSDQKSANKNNNSSPAENEKEKNNSNTEKSEKSEKSEDRELNKYALSELTFKSKKVERLSRIYNYLKTRIRELKQSHIDAIEKSSISSSAPLLLSPSPLVLRDVQMRPSPSSRRKLLGRLEAHLSGFRFSDSLSATTDIPYFNISDLIFQENYHTEALILIHLQLSKPILVNKKQTSFVQFYYDSVTSSVDSTTRLSSSSNDKAKNKRFLSNFNSFVSSFNNLITSDSVMKIKDNKDLKFKGVERVKKDLVFLGNLSRSMTPCFLTGRYLLALNDTPLLVRLKDVRMAYFERMVVGVNSSDLALVFWDIHRDPVRIASINRTDVDMVRAYFATAGVRVMEGHVNLDWKTIISEVRGDIRNFVNEGGWDFLQGEDEEDEQEESEEAFSVESESVEGSGSASSEGGSSEGSGSDGSDSEGGEEKEESLVDWSEETQGESD